MNALFGDFGIASFYQNSSSTSTGGFITSSLGVKGTIGYIAPGNYRPLRGTTNYNLREAQKLVHGVLTFRT